MRIFGICLGHRWSRWHRRTVTVGVPQATEFDHRQDNAPVMLRVCHDCGTSQMRGLH
jgi:hypothetical protein